MIIWNLLAIFSLFEERHTDDKKMPAAVDTRGHELMTMSANGSVSYSRPRGADAHEHDAGPSKKKLKTAHDEERSGEQPNGSTGGDQQSQLEEGEQKEEEEVARIAIAPPTAESMKLVQVLQQALHQDWHHNVFSFEDFVKQEQGLRLDHGEQESYFTLFEQSLTGVQCW